MHKFLKVTVGMVWYGKTVLISKSPKNNKYSNIGICK